MSQALIQVHRTWGHEFLFDARSPGAGWDWYDATIPTSEPAKPGGNWNLPLKALLHRGATVIDAGANVGWTTVLFALEVGPTGRVIAIEADPAAAASIRANVARNGLNNVEVIHAAVWDVPGHAITFRAQVLRPGENGTRIETVTLDQFGPADVVKVDVEGAEVAAMRGAESLLRSGARFEVELHARPEGVDMRREFGHDPDELLRIFDCHGYSIRHQRAGLDPISIASETGGVMWAVPRPGVPPCE